mmetsp:Transcript_86893/g.186131  ORF Transcript_86893/g.186131 Transcript_86893/m.186131 type:complete len:130 (-) Transcript_86893:278-667(-)
MEKCCSMGDLATTHAQDAQPMPSQRAASAPQLHCGRAQGRRLLGGARVQPRQVERSRSLTSDEWPPLLIQACFRPPSLPDSSDSDTIDPDAAEAAAPVLHQAAQDHGVVEHVEWVGLCQSVLVALLPRP